MEQWPASATQGQQVSAQRWIDLMKRRGTWVDQAFLLAAADYLKVDIRYYVVNTQGEYLYASDIHPSGDATLLARVELGYIVDLHYSAILPNEEQPEDGVEL